MRFLASIFVLSLCLLPFLSRAEDSEKKLSPEEMEKLKSYLEKAQAFEKTLKYQTGKVQLGSVGQADIPPEFRFLGSNDSKKLLEEGWDNLPGPAPLGMLIPADTSPLSGEGWGIVITYEEDGHVKDEDADSMNYDEVLKQLQEHTKAANEERKKHQMEEMNLVGWATAPRYDKQSKKMYWAKEYAVGNNPVHTLNYDIRILGRKGVLILSAVASISQLKMIEQQAPKTLAFVNFTPGNTYADFNDSTDKVAEYGIGGLILGGIAAKTGLLKGLFLILAKFGKVILVGVLAFFGFIAKMLGMKKDKPAETNSTPS